MKNQDKKRLKIALTLLAEIRQCPDDEKFKETNYCVFCDDPDPKVCWFKYVNWKLRKQS